jgi:hypothetical protein
VRVIKRGTCLQVEDDEFATHGFDDAVGGASVFEIIVDEEDFDELGQHLDSVRLCRDAIRLDVFL